MIRHSEIGGKPAAILLMAACATVAICPHWTRSVAKSSRRADVVVVAVGIWRFRRLGMIKSGAAVIDIGIDQVVDPNGEPPIVGEVEADSVSEIAGWITAVPASAGAAPGAILLRNATDAHTRKIVVGWVN